MTAKCVLFDLDNTLTDRRQSITNFTRRFHEQFAGQLGEISFDKLELAIQQGDNLGYKPKSQMFLELAHDLPWREPVSAETIRAFWYAESPACMQPRPGMLETLTTLRTRGLRIGMITNGRTIVQNATIDAIGVRDLMEVIVISEEAGIRKPDADIFRIALDALKVTSEETWYVGDHPHSDIHGAKNAEITGVWVRRGGHTWPNDQPEPDYTIDELPEILHFFADQP